MKKNVKLYDVAGKCPFCKPGINRIGSVFRSGPIEIDMPHIHKEWKESHFITRNCEKTEGIGLSIRLTNLIEDPDYTLDNPIPTIDATVDTKDRTGVLATDFLPDISIPIRFCPMCGRKIGDF